MGSRNKIVVVSACLFYENLLLTLRRSADRKVYAGAWEVVSGRVGTGEDLRVAMLREIAEETGLDAVLVSDPFDAYEAAYGADTMRVHIFAGRAHQRRVTLSDEHDAHRWVTLATFASLCPFARLVDAARQAFDLVRKD